jgi:hypothetical protein
MQRFEDWLKDATPDDKIAIAKRSLAAVGELGTTYQDQFVQEVRGDPTAGKVFDSLKETI